MGLIAWIVLGVATGWLAGLMMGDRLSMTWSVTCGIVGALLGGLVYDLSGSKGIGMNLWSIFASFVGACFVLLIAHLILAWNNRMA